MAYFNSQWQSGKLFCCSHFSKSSCWLFAPPFYLLKCPLGEKYFSMNLQGGLASFSKVKLGPVFSSINMGRTFYKSMLGCMGWPFITKLLFQPHLPSFVTCVSDIKFASHLAVP